ncbi:hypothetical protein L207DRAFT_309324 [Hyaloscypha variabilis F]|uniref:Uncharacterized protein n=1 Tax=Hyaloscypha variabilis (strain UAMH 11265 / GT02V1 / F) TaxID=1149755 RepID=A0A2J6RUZ4_HYAVF|nr:hypothetical protein L207DRAFT_309324 [Hyaloscypha variabilis F]
MPQLRSTTRNPARAQNSQQKTTSKRNKSNASKKSNLVSNAPSRGVPAVDFNLGHPGGSTATEEPVIDDGAAAQAALHEELGGSRAHDSALANVGAGNTAAEDPMTLDTGDDSPAISCDEDTAMTEPAGADSTNTTDGAVIQAVMEPAADSHTHTSEVVTATQAVTEPAGAGSTNINDDGTATQAVMEPAADSHTEAVTATHIVMEPGADSTSTTDDGTADQAVTKHAGAESNTTGSPNEPVAHTITPPTDETTATATEGSGPDAMVTSASGNANAASTGTRTLLTGRIHSADLPASHEASSPDRSDRSSPGSTSQIGTPDLANADERPPQENGVAIDLTHLGDDDAAGSRSDRESKILGARTQARDCHVAVMVEALEEMVEQVFYRDGSGIENDDFRMMDFIEMEKDATDMTIKGLEVMLEDAKRYRRRLNRARI